MNKLFNDLGCVRAYIDDLLIISNGNFEDHLIKGKIVSKKIKVAGFKINALNKEDLLHPTSFKTIMRFQQKGKFLIEIAKEMFKVYAIKQFHGASKTYSLICRHRKIVIQKQIHKTLLEWYHKIQ